MTERTAKRKVTEESFAEKKAKKDRTSTVTITFGDQAENHKGMQVIGKKKEHGFTYKELRSAKEDLEKKGFKCELVELAHEGAEEASVLVVRNGIESMGVDKVACLSTEAGRTVRRTDVVGVRQESVYVWPCRQQECPTQPLLRRERTGTGLCTRQGTCRRLRHAASLVPVSFPVGTSLWGQSGRTCGRGQPLLRHQEMRHWLSR
jgi:hypothetical protein